ncbi:hypothetical protein HHX47_DHR2000149 [Lentinula edodes]|nr:hypothetical protein HHX47_DHR2000149 [Lentinula edodes]
MSYGLLQLEGTTDLQSKTLSDIPKDIQQLEWKFNLDVETTMYTICLQCSYTYPLIFSDNSPKPMYPLKCMHCPMALAEPCSGSLLLDSGHPIKAFEVYSFLNWFGRFIALPGIAQYSDIFCMQISDEQPPEDKESACDGWLHFELRGPDGKLFVCEREKEGRWFFKLHADFFNIKENLHSGKHNSTGIITREPKNKNMTPVSSISHYYQFTPPPPLSLVNSAPIMPIDSAEEDLVTAVLEWEYLSNNLQHFCHQCMSNLLVKIDTYKQELIEIHHLLSSLHPSTDLLQMQLRSRLKSKK